MKQQYLVCLAVVVAMLAGCSSHQACWEASPVSPVKVLGADVYEDGGTAFVVFTDARGCKYRVCRDRRESELEGSRDLYLNAIYPTDEGARVLDRESPQAQAIRGALVDWFESRVTEKVKMQIFEQKTVVGLDESEMMTARVLEVIRGFGEYQHPSGAASN